MNKSVDAIRSGSAHAPQLVVHDADGPWTRLLRRFVSPAIEVVAAEALVGGARPLATMNHSAVLLPIPCDLAADGLQWIDRWKRRQGAGLLIAAVAPGDVTFDWALRAVGATWVVHQLWDAEVAAHLVERFWKQKGRPDLSLRDQIWNNLPWAKPSEIPGAPLRSYPE